MEIKRIEVVGAEMYKGAGRAGIDLGPRAIRHAGLFDTLTAMGLDFCDHGDVSEACEAGNCNKACACARTNHAADKNGLKNLSAVNEVNTALFQKVSGALASGGFPLVLGGDHSIAAATVSAVASHYKKIGVIWVDAHGDYNSATSSPTGNIHGTPLSAVTGFGPEQILPFLQKDAHFVSPKNAVIVGARDLDGEEKKRLKQAGITVFSIEDIDREGMPAIAQKAIKIALDGTQGLYLSFDLDAIDPSSAPGVSTPVMGGMTVREGNLLCEYACASGKLLGAEVVELNPLRDCKNQTGQLAVQLIGSLLGRHIM